jgi:hypothetical protein
MSTLEKDLSGSQSAFAARTLLVGYAGAVVAEAEEGEGRDKLGKERKKILERINSKGRRLEKRSPAPPIDASETQCSAPEGR